VDQNTGEETYIPPYTNPDTMEGLFYQDFTTSDINSEGNSSDEGGDDFTNSSTTTTNGEDSTNQGIYDGYTEILKVNGDASRDTDLEAMRKARIANCQGFIEPVDEESV